jgi:hypothetical protein
MIQQNPQPQPEQFGYVPGKPTVSKENPMLGRESILTTIGGQVEKAQAATQQSQAGAPTGGTGGQVQ